jgi:hypothetical protein
METDTDANTDTDTARERKRDRRMDGQAGRQAGRPGDRRRKTEPYARARLLLCTQSRGAGRHESGKQLPHDAREHGRRGGEACPLAPLALSQAGPPRAAPGPSASCLHRLPTCLPAWPAYGCHAVRTLMCMQYVHSSTYTHVYARVRVFVPEVGNTFHWGTPRGVHVCLRAVVAAIIYDVWCTFRGL